MLELHRTFKWRGVTTVAGTLALLAAGTWARAGGVADEELEALLGGSPETAPARMSSTLSGVSNRSNPAISVNGLLLGTGSDEGSSDFGLQEFELRFTSDIDPHFRADVTFAMHQDLGDSHAEEEEGAGAHEDEPAIEIEQAEISAISLPNVGLRFGRFWLPFGKHNTFHTHQFPFVTSPVVIEETFGEEALNEMAVDVAPLLPLPFFSEVNLVAFQGENEPLFQFAEDADGTPREGPDKARFLIHWKNLFDLTDDDTIEAGVSYAGGKNNYGDGAETEVSGADLTYKHRPAFGRGRAGTVLQAEWIETAREADQVFESSGYYVSAQWRALEFWWLQARHGAFVADTIENGARVEAEWEHTDWLVAWVPTEFSALRIQYSNVRQHERTVAFWYLQYNFVIGAHPAHSY